MKTKLILLFALMSTLAFTQDLSNDKINKPVDKSIKEKKSPVMPFFIIEQEAEIINTQNASGENVIKYDRVDMLTTANAGFIYKVMPKLMLKPFIKSYLIWDIDTAGNPSILLDELAFNFGIIYKPLDWFTFGGIIANANVFQPNKAVWIGFKTNLNFNFDVKEYFFNLDLKNTNKPVFQKDFDNSGKITMKVWLTNQFESEITYNVFNYLNPKANSGFYVYNNFIYTTIMGLKGKVGMEKLSNDFYGGFVFSPLDIFSAKLLFTLYNERFYESLLAKTQNELGAGFKVSAAFNIQWFTLEAAYSTKIYRVVNDVVTHPIHTFQFNTSIKLGGM